MPNRTPAERKLIDSLPKKAPDKYCNGRTGHGYCNLPAGYKTEHLGSGRCKFHGGRAGRNPVHGLYSKNLTSTVKKEFDKLASNPQLVNLNAELGLAKVMLSNLLSNVEEQLADGNFWTKKSKGVWTISPEANAMIRVLELISKMYEKIAKVEEKSQDNLKPKDVFFIINQVKINIDNNCQDCPVRKHLATNLDQTRFPNAVKDAEVIKETINKQIK